VAVARPMHQARRDINTIRFVPDPSKEDLKALVDGVIRAQGNDFIKDLLRRKQLPIGTNKAQFSKHLKAAIDAGTVLAADIDDWLHEVEGWGNQTIYLYRLSAADARDRLWTDESLLRRRVTKAGHGGQWAANTSVAFDTALTLTGVHALDGGRLRFEWHQGITVEDRAPERDFTRDEGDETIQYRAYLLRRQRTVMRFEIRPRQRLAAAFVQVPVSSKEHDAALAAMWEVVGCVRPQGTFRPINMSTVIKKVDEDTKSGPLRTNTVRLSTPGAWIAYGAEASDAAYREVQDANEARSAVATMTRFTGRRSNLLYAASRNTDRKDRDVHVQLDGTRRRLWVRAQLTEAQAWDLLVLLTSYA